MESVTKTTAVEESVGGNGRSPQHNNSTESAPVKSVLTEEMLARFASRAANYDRENRFFEEDFKELQAAKYLLMPVPVKFGGAGCRWRKSAANSAASLTMRPPRLSR